MRNNKNAKIVWPKEGGIVSPFTLLVRSDTSTNLEPVIRYFTSEYVRNVCKQASLPQPQDYMDMLKENNQRLNWVGWEFVENHDTNRLLIELNKYFL